MITKGKKFFHRAFALALYITGANLHVKSRQFSRLADRFQVCCKGFPVFIGNIFQSISYLMHDATLVLCFWKSGSNCFFDSCQTREYSTNHHFRLPYPTV